MTPRSAAERGPGMQRCRFVSGLDGARNCVTHGWSGWREEVKTIRVCPAAGATAAMPPIEAARREAALLTLIALVAQMIEPDYDISEQGGRRWIDVDRAYALLHDSAGATGDEVGEP